MHNKLQGCTVDVQAATLILAALEQTMHHVETPNVCHGALHDVSVMDGKFQTVIVNVHAHALNLTFRT